ncbi:hypothetical protein [Streptomyces luteolus]|uniref:Uncharacterized protein n=1 Tax=Streptomyces luteolus TaxID=3043615 RepID=A0ABT6T3D6_9ACTN|nr:hypothetical protein [Streptomyces sp. B-S-A12]MDI3422150.1 hypothetical protein [Streptomyces sp. B-S-A12]
MTTDDERHQRAEWTRAYLAEHFGVYVTDEESAAMGRRLREAFAEAQRDRGTRPGAA